jgi:hypothetical protein
MDKPNLWLVIKKSAKEGNSTCGGKNTLSGRKNDTERHREALKRGIIFSAMGKKVFFNPHVELLIS